MTGKNKEFTEFELVRFLVDDYLREKRALPVWEIEKRSDFDQTRVLELFDGPRLQRDMVDDLGDETFESEGILFILLNSDLIKSNCSLLKSLI